MKFSLSQESLDAIHTAGKKQWVTDLIKAIVFCTVTEIVLLLCSSSGKYLSRKYNPALFWGIFAVIILFFVIKFKIFYPLFHRSSTGSVIDIKNDVVIDGVEKDVKGSWFATPSTDLGKVDTCEITVQNSKGKTSRYVFKREVVGFARLYYRKGDNVACLPYAKYPFNYDNRMPQPFCIHCGTFLDAGEKKCSACGIPFSVEEADEIQAEEMP